MAFQISSEQQQLQASINLPYSKSLSNRALILAAAYRYLQLPEPILENLSEADDTLILKEALTSNAETINLKNAGTCLRFLMAFFAATPGSKRILTGSERLKQRPIKGLVDALQALGADITYLDKEGSLPILIQGKTLTGGKIVVEANLSSQFVSALMLVSPLMEQALEISLKGKAVSTPYIEMTAKLLQQFGLNLNYTTDFKEIKCEGKFDSNLQRYSIERDWSSAAFFFEATLLACDAELFLEGLQLDSLQGDKQIAQWMQDLGIVVMQEKEGLYISVNKIDLPSEIIKYDLSDYPDLAPALVCALAGSNIAFEVSGLESLKVKESDRVLALKEGLNQLGYDINMPAEGTLTYTGKPRAAHLNAPIINTHADHRMVMAFGMMAIKLGVIHVSEIASVEKSFPNFFEEARKIGVIG
ncbi:MAG: 3-phosphoshikimate 1-carboxyvinyltransferase [Bacteroidetes bacterium]|nr:3-phosphoshikimate 1-carboxyvinyltransferase [Bacteroidota bacterium]